MQKVIGTVRKTDLEGGSWTLQTEQGVIYQLRGGGEDLLHDGIRAEVEGQIDNNQIGLAMMGDVLEIKSYRIL